MAKRGIVAAAGQAIHPHLFKVNTSHIADIWDAYPEETFKTLRLGQQDLLENDELLSDDENRGEAKAWSWLAATALIKTRRGVGLMLVKKGGETREDGVQLCG